MRFTLGLGPAHALYDGLQNTHSEPRRQRKPGMANTQPASTFSSLCTAKEKTRRSDAGSYQNVNQWMCSGRQRLQPLGEPRYLARGRVLVDHALARRSHQLRL